MTTRPGDIFRDKDPRSDGRHLKVFEVNGLYARCVPCDAAGMELPGKRTRISLQGLETRFVKVGGSCQLVDLERAALARLKEWERAMLKMEALLKVPREERATSWNEKYLDAIEVHTSAHAALRAVADSLLEAEE